MESKILVIIIILFIQTNSQIKQNPILLINSIEPIDPLVLSSKDQYYYIITSGKDLQIEKDNLESQLKIAQADYEANKEMEKQGAQNLKPDYTGQA